MTATPRSMVRAVLHAPGVRTARKAAERAVTPEARVGLVHLQLQLADQAAQLDRLRHTMADVEANLPAVLNAISSMSGASRVVKRELDALRAQFESFRADSEAAQREQAAAVSDVGDRVAAGDHEVLGQIRPHVETLAWLMQRVETVRFEMLNELRYGANPDGRSAFEPRVVNPEALEASPLRLNIGAGHIPIDGYVNIDMRELPGIDVIAMVDELPFEPGTVDEIYSSHTLEHFPQEVLRRRLLPYWASLLKPGGVLTTVAPDLEAMSADLVRGETSFEDYREVVYGGQEYEGDTHFTGFTPDSFGKLLDEAGFEATVTTAVGRPNGKCKEFEITARKPS